MLIPKKVSTEKLEGQTRGNFVQRVLAKSYCGVLDHSVWRWAGDCPKEH